MDASFQPCYNVYQIRLYDMSDCLVYKYAYASEAEALQKLDLLVAQPWALAFSRAVVRCLDPAGGGWLVPAGLCFFLDPEDYGEFDHAASWRLNLYGGGDQLLGARTSQKKITRRGVERTLLLCNARYGVLSVRGADFPPGEYTVASAWENPCFHRIVLDGAGEPVSPRIAGIGEDLMPRYRKALEEDWAETRRMEERRV